MAKAKTDFTDYMQAFEDELNSFVKRVEDRAKARIEKAKKEAEKVLYIIVYTVHRREILEGVGEGREGARGSKREGEIICTQ